MHAPIATGSGEGRLERVWNALLDPATRTHYWGAVSSVLLLLLLAWALHPWLTDRGAYVIFIPAVFIAAGFGGFGPGLLATALSAVFGFLLTRQGSFAYPEILEPSLFALVGLGISWFGEQRRKARLRSHKSAHDLLAREAHLRSSSTRSPTPPWSSTSRGSSSPSAPPRNGCSVTASPKFGTECQHADAVALSRGP